MTAISRARAFLDGDATQCPQTVVADLLAHIEQCALLGGTRAPAAVPDGYALVKRELIERVLASLARLDRELGWSMDDQFAADDLEMAMLAAAPAPAESKPAEGVIDEMVARFLAWPLPDSVCPDRATNDPARLSGKYRELTGTSLLTADEARAMLTHVLQAQAADGDGVTEEMVGRALRAYFELGGNFWHAAWTSEQRRLMRAALEAALRGQGVGS